jgi:leader peptidase (prepilin peptidase)/N-methyltransferase
VGRVGLAALKPWPPARLTGAAWLQAGLVTAGFVAVGLRFGPSPLLPALCYLVAAGAALAFIDAVSKRLPDLLTLPSYPLALVMLGAAAPFIPNGWWHFTHALIGLAAGGAFYVLLAVIYPVGIGWGDVKLSGLLGLYLGWFGARTWFAGLLGGFVLAAVTGIALIAAGRATRKSQLPFGPFMLAGALAAILASGLVGFLVSAAYSHAPWHLTGICATETRIVRTLTGGADLAGRGSGRVAVGWAWCSAYRACAAFGCGIDSLPAVRRMRGTTTRRSRSTGPSAIISCTSLMLPKERSGAPGWCWRAVISRWACAPDPGSG